MLANLKVTLIPYNVFNLGNRKIINFIDTKSILMYLFRAVYLHCVFIIWIKLLKGIFEISSYINIVY